MKKFLAFVKKEFWHILRDRRTLMILFGMPVIQILLFGFALSNEVKNAKIAVLDFAHDDASRQISQTLESSHYFDIEKNLHSEAEIEQAFREGIIKMVIVFPQNFRDDYLHGNRTSIQLITDASDPNTGNTLANYTTAIIGDYQMNQRQGQALPLSIGTEVKMLYNPQMEASFNFVPGVMAMILLLVCAMMTSIAIVREKEMGTMEILLVSPMRPLTVIVSKAIPYATLSLLNVASIVALSYFVLQLPIQGNLIFLFAESLLYITTSLSLGLLISSIVSSQETAMFASMMVLMLPTIMFSGFMFPVENMPLPLQIISNIIPAKWFFQIIKSVMLKGVGIEFVWKETVILLGMTLALIGLAIRNFKIRLE